LKQALHVTEQISLVVKGAEMAEILIVEDDADLVETYMDLFEHHGHQGLPALNISQATECLLRTKPEIITFDLNLPGGSSGAISNFMNIASMQNDSKIIVISGHPEIMTGMEWMDHVDLVLTKPIDNQTLMMMISRLLAS
jgi:two-component system phosphoglycerate transport system response regulator PgtA